MPRFLDRITGQGRPPKAATATAARAAAGPTKGASSNRTIQPAEYGLPLRAELRTDRSVDDPALDAAVLAAKGGNWQPVGALMWETGRDWERRYLYTSIFAGLAAEDERWLQAWRQAHPQDPAAAAIEASSLVQLAWKIRSSDVSSKVGREQWDGFFRVLRQVPELCREAAALSPDDPTPWVVLLGAAKGLQWKNDEFRAVWAEVLARDPHHVLAHISAQSYWLPRWFGSTDLVLEFTEQAIAAAPDGSLLSLLRLDLLNRELRPTDTEPRPAFWRGEQVQWAIDEALIDLAAADPANIRINVMRSWLAIFLVRSERWAEAVEQFRAIGRMVAFEPWTYSEDGTSLFTQQRAIAVLGWEDAGRPAVPPLSPHRAAPAGSYFDLSTPNPDADPVTGK
ncbi:hypothetical protein [Streptacidiphilus sp. PAMC 29251]